MACVIIIAVSLLAVVWVGSATAFPPGVSPQLKAWAKKWRGQDKRARKRLVRADRCLSLSPPAALRAWPRADTWPAWTAAGKAWRSQALASRAALSRRLHRMRHPGGSGAPRWAPLARWVRWPAGQIANVVRHTREESGGSPRASNGTFRGLLQIHVCHAAEFRRVTGRPYFNAVYEPQANLAFALWLWRHGGWSQWSTP